MKTARPLLALALAAVLAPAAAGCGKSAGDAPAVPASSDPEGKDLVEGAVVGALEKVGGIRLYKITHVDDYPDPIGYEYHMIAYDPKAPTYAEAAQVWKKGDKKIALEHLVVRAVNFLPRDHRVLAVEPLTEAERTTYIKARDSRALPTNVGDLPK